LCFQKFPKTYTKVDKLTGKISSYLCSDFSCFVLIFPWVIYVKSANGNFTKIVPSTIGAYLDAEALAYWIMCDGTKVKDGGLELCTDSFTL